MKESVIVDLNKYARTAIVSGRPAGDEARKREKLDRADDNHLPIIVLVPESIEAITTSFLGGLLGLSIVKEGSIEKAKARISIKIVGGSPSKTSAINGALEREMRRVLSRSSSLFS